jgi:hypothetical protein
MNALRSATGNAVNVRLSPELFARLSADDFAPLHKVEALANGMSERDMTYYADCGLLMYTNIVCAPDPVYVQTREALQQSLAERTAAGRTEFSVICSDELYAQMLADERAQLNAVENDAGIRSRSLSWYNSRRLLIYTEVLPMNAGEVCSTEEQVVAALKNAAGGAVGVRVTPELYTVLSANGFDRQHALEGQAGIMDRSMMYYDDKQLMEYTDIVYAENLLVAQDLDSFRTQLAAQSDALAETITIHCSDELYNHLKQDDFYMLYEMEHNCGQLWRDMTYYDGKRIIEYKNIEYYPGMRIVRAVQAGRTDLLTADEMQLYQVALGIVTRAQSESENLLSLEAALNDAIDQNCVYELNEETDYYVAGDTAFGPLMLGKADCDGYADAFFLLGNLAGFNVRFQNGDSRDDEDDEDYEDDMIGHMWNTVELNGQWYFVDATWNDHEPYNHHLCLNFGADLARTRYVWLPEACVVQPAETTNFSYSYNKMKGTSFETMATAQGFVNDRIANGRAYVNFVVHNTAYPDADAFNTAFLEGLTVGYRSNRTYLGDYISYIIRPYD